MKWFNRFWILCFAVSAAILGVFIVLSFLGWRENVTILTGTVPPGSNHATASMKALVYLASYFGTVLLVPILVLTNGISYVLVHLMKRQEEA